MASAFRVALLFSAQILIIKALAALPSNDALTVPDDVIFKTEGLDWQVPLLAVLYFLGEVALHFVNLVVVSLVNHAFLLNEL